MFFLLRTAFWLSIVLVLLPSGGAPQSVALKFDAADAVSAAAATVSDMSGFCSRQPDACVVGGQAASAFGQRAQAGAKFLYEYLHDRMAPAETGSVAPRSKTQTASSQPQSQHTLTPADAKPAWRGALPQPLPPRDPRRPA